MYNDLTCLVKTNGLDFPIEDAASTENYIAQVGLKFIYTCIYMCTSSVTGICTSTLQKIKTLPLLNFYTHYVYW